MADNGTAEPGARARVVQRGQFLTMADDALQHVLSFLTIVDAMRLGLASKMVLDTVTAHRFSDTTTPIRWEYFAVWLARFQRAAAARVSAVTLLGDQLWLPHGLVHLNVSECSLGVAGARLLAAGLTSLMALKHLDLSRNRLGVAEVVVVAEEVVVVVGMTVLAGPLGLLTQLEHLDASHNLLRVEGTHALAAAFPSLGRLQHLNLSYNELGVDVVVARGVIVRGMTVLAGPLRLLTQLEHLDASHNFLRVEGTRALAAAFPSLGRLQHLNLSLNELGPIGAGVLAAAQGSDPSSAAPEQFPALLTLNLSGNGLGADGMKQLAPAFNQMAALRELDVSTNHVGTGDIPSGWSDGLAHLRNLRSLRFRGNDIGAQRMAELAGSLRSLVQLQLLNVSWNNMGDDGCGALAHALLDKPLVELYVAGNRIGLDGMVTLFPLLRLLRLQTLDLSTNSLGATAAEQLGGLCRTLPGLRLKLYMWANELGAQLTTLRNSLPAG
jgi:Ran GTPase-activating protein (RanGAP) involved in mRNA processing and transport